MPKFRRQLGVRRPAKNWYKIKIQAGKKNIHLQNSCEMTRTGVICECLHLCEDLHDEGFIQMQSEKNTAVRETLEGLSAVEVQAALTLIEFSMVQHRVATSQGNQGNVRDLESRQGNQGIVRENSQNVREKLHK